MVTSPIPIKSEFRCDAAGIWPERTAVALPRMLEKIEAELATTARPGEKERLRQRAEMVRALLAPTIALSRSS